MKILKNHALTLSMLIGAVASIAIAGFTSFADECEKLPNEIMRLHILADSNSEKDQLFKYQLRDYLLENVGAELSETETLADAVQKSEELLPEIERLSAEFAKQNNYNKEIKAEITEMYFTTRVYDDNFTLPAGNYTALRITIGSGEGNNWWCVMFPMLCQPAYSTSSPSEKVKVKTANAVNVPKSVTSSPKIKFALFEMMTNMLE